MALKADGPIWDAAMGLTALKPGVKRTDTQLFLGVPVPADATNAG